MTTLFSPVGTADPFTTLGDGPLLHIVRTYNPDSVVMFLSPKMAEFEARDQRYTRGITDLSESLGRSSPQIEIIESEKTEVHHFDDFIEDFGDELRILSAENPDESILVNVTSGTPGMQQALVALGSFGELNLEMVQVATPNRGMNHSSDREDPDEFDYDTLWEMVREIEAEKPSRCRRIETPNFADQLLKRNIEALVRRYDYEAAYVLARESNMISDRTKDMIDAAGCRLNLLQQKPSKVFAKSPISYRSNDKLLEYLNVMQVRLNQGHWGEFVRSLTPPLTEVLTKYVAVKIPTTSFAKRDRKDALVFDFDAVEKNGLSKVFSKRVKAYKSSKESKDGRVFIPYVGNNDLMKLAEHLYGDDVDDRLRDLRDFEENVRNGLAHMMEGASKEQIEKKGGLQLETVMQYLFDLHDELMLVNVKAEPDLYDRINEAIIAELRRPA